VTGPNLKAVTHNAAVTHTMRKSVGWQWDFHVHRQLHHRSAFIPSSAGRHSLGTLCKMCCDSTAPVGVVAAPVVLQW